jgi:hypothetical protein
MLAPHSYEESYTYQFLTPAEFSKTAKVTQTRRFMSMVFIHSRGTDAGNVWILEFYERRHKRLKMNYYA